MHSVNLPKSISQYLHDTRLVEHNASSKIDQENKHAKPYEVRELDFTNLFDPKKLSAVLIKRRNIDSKGNQINWLKIKLRKFQKNYLSRYSSLFVYDVTPLTFLTTLTRSYKKPIPVSEVMKNDLLIIRSVKNKIFSDEKEDFYCNE